MTRLRKMMLENSSVRNYSEATTRCYIRTVEDSQDDSAFSRLLGPEHIREYQAELFKERKLSPGTVTQRWQALRFFYIKTLKKTGASPRALSDKSVSPSSILSRKKSRDSSTQL